MTYQNRVNNGLRRDWYARGDYWVYMARGERLPTVMDPVTGKPWPVSWGDHPASLMLRQVGRAAYAAMARAAYANARLFPSPLP